MQKRFECVCPILFNSPVNEDCFELKIFAPKIAPHCAPGQFFMLEIPGVFLRRPLSIYNADKEFISFLYKTVGKGSKALSKLKSEIALLGPLGKGYAMKGADILPVLIAGGMGIASLNFLIRKIKRRGILFYGAKSRKDLICANEIERLGWDVLRATEDGSAGYKGFITDIVAIADYLPKNTMIYICGPSAMTKAVLKIVRGKGFSAQASLEEHMACGLGICQGCAVKIKGENKMVCKDGPVFNAGDIDYED